MRILNTVRFSHFTLVFRMKSSKSFVDTYREVWLKSGESGVDKNDERTRKMPFMNPFKCEGCCNLTHPVTRCLVTSYMKFFLHEFFVILHKRLNSQQNFCAFTHFFHFCKKIPNVINRVNSFQAHFYKAQ